MKRILSYAFPAVACLILLSACSEEYKIDKPASQTKYLAVESIFTDMKSFQTVKLSESIPYTGKDESRPVSGAQITISDTGDDSIFEFAEDSKTPGLYRSTKFCSGEIGHTYKLRIELEEEDGTNVYEGTSTMREFGFDIKKIDYKYSDSLVDSLWTIGIWGSDKSSKDNYLILPVVNGNSYPVDHALPLEDKYFSGATVYGYPISVLNQTWSNVKIYGQCAKPLEKGDIISLLVYDMPDDFHKYMTALVESTSSISIPILSSQPANLPTNMKGKNVVGYFSACPGRIVSCIVDDPYRQKFLDEISSGQ